MEKKKQLEFLNTLRFLSVILIVFAHFNYQCFSHYYSENILDSFWYNNSSWIYWIFYGVTGKYAVAMMCIISGFLVAKKFYRKAVDFGKFIFNRYLRLMLPIFATCTIYVIISMFQGKFISLSSYLNGVLWLGNGTINDHLGYILDFFLGNVLIALVTYLFSNRKYFPIMYIPLMILLYFMDKIWILATVMGGLTYHLCVIIKEKKLYKYWYLIIVVPIVWWLPRGEEKKIIYLRDAIACSIILITFYCLPKLQKIINWSKLSSIKKVSYSLFVTHGLVNTLVSGGIVEYFKNINIISNVYLVQLLTFIIVLAIDLIISTIIYYFVEYKLFNFINKFLSNKVNNYEIKLLQEGEKEVNNKNEDKFKLDFNLKNIHIILMLIGTAFIFSSVFHSNIWFDEAYSVGLANQSFLDIWKIGGHDVHPVLYYWMLRIVNLLSNGSILAYRLFSTLPIALLGLLGFTHIKKDFGEKTGIIFSFLCYFLPIMAVDANQIRMYTWAIYIVSILAIYAYRIYLGQSTKKNWLIFGIFSLASIYIHYYGLMAAGLINVFLLIYFIKNKKWNELKWQIPLGIIQLVLYIPWLIYLAAQMKHVSKGFWIEHEPHRFLQIIGFQMEGIINVWVGFIANVLLFVILGIIVFRKRRDKTINWKPAIFSILIYVSVILAALIITKVLNSAILYYRYLFVITGLYIFTISYILSKEDNMYIVLIVCSIILLLGINNTVIQAKENYADCNGKQIEYLRENIQEDDVLVYRNIGNGSVFASNFLNNKQYFYNPEDWGVVEAYKAWAPQMETCVTTDFLYKCTGRVWIIDSQDNGFYNELFNNKKFKYISTQCFETEYRAYTYNITLVERIKK